MAGGSRLNLSCYRSGPPIRGGHETSFAAATGTPVGRPRSRRRVGGGLDGQCHHDGRGPEGPKAELDGRPITLGDVSAYYCHDRAYPVIRCFGTSLERDRNEGLAGAATKPAPDSDNANAITTAAYPYVRWYLDANYGGPSFDASIAYSNLGSLGWNDKISSFSVYPGGHPRWWRDVGLTGGSWDWGTTSVPYVGDAANDQFSSVGRL